jgi:uncharacterized phage-associated protein
MKVSAHDVAAVLRARQSALGTKKLHKLLYYCQGHHLAAFGSPLFAESIGAWDMGPVVESLWAAEKYGSAPPPRAALDEAGLNTVGYVLSRYGGLTGHDLEVMTHGEPPWRLADAARRPGTGAPIRAEWIRDFFRGEGAPDDGVDDPPPDLAAVAEWLESAPPTPPAPSPTEPVDTPQALRAWAARGA